VRRVALIVGLCAVAAACGSSSASYTVQKTQACLVGKGFKISHSVDFVASTATGGSLRTFFPDNDVTVVFGDTESDAANLDQAYRRFHSENVGIDDVLFQKGNAVMLWHFHPADADATTLTDCLK
jgi:polyisoprenoid-binding protein YceI